MLARWRPLPSPRAHCQRFAPAKSFLACQSPGAIPNCVRAPRSLTPKNWLGPFLSCLETLKTR